MTHVFVEKKCENIFLSITSQYLRESNFEGFQASHICRPDETRMNMIMCMKQWWNDTDKGNCKYLNKTSSK